MLVGHQVRNCPQRGRGAPVESSPKTQHRSQFVTREKQQSSPTVKKETEPKLGEETEQKSSEETVEEALSQMMATLHGVHAIVPAGEIQLGTVPMAEVAVGEYSCVCRSGVGLQERSTPLKELSEYKRQLQLIYL